MKSLVAAFLVIASTGSVLAQEVQKETRTSDKAQEKIACAPGFTENTPLYILDEVEICPEDLKKIEPANIEKIDVIKEKSATELYGEKGNNGVIIITTKKKNQPSGKG